MKVQKYRNCQQIQAANLVLQIEPRCLEFDHLGFNPSCHKDKSFLFSASHNQSMC